MTAAAIETIRCSIRGMIRWKDSIEATTLSWASITPFGVPVVPDVKMSSQSSSGSGRGHRRQLRLPVGRERARPGRRVEVLDGRRREVLEPGLAGIGRVTSRAEDRGASRRTSRRSRRRVGRHPEVERHEDQPRPDRPEVDRRELGRRRGPGQDPSRRVQAEADRGATPRSRARRRARGRTRSRRAVIAPQSERGAIGVRR